jgi:hypothetical protein
MLKKYRDTVGKFYNELVEHSGKVTMEDFWQRYEYRCGDLTRVMKELQLARQYEHLQKTKTNNNNKKKKKKQEQHQSSSPSPLSGDVSTCGSRSRSYLSCLNVEEDPEVSKPREKSKAPEQASQPRVVDPAGTMDTVDDEHHHHHHHSDTAVNTVVVLDHMAKFKQGLHNDHGTPTIAEASAMETTKTMEQEEEEEEEDVDSLTDDGSNRESNNNNVPSIFRRTTENVDQKKTAHVVASSDVEKKDDEVDDEQKVVVVSFLKEKSNKTGATLMMIWITCILFALCLQTPNSTIPLYGSYHHHHHYYYYGNVLCGPIRPGKTLDASSLAAENIDRMDGKKNYVSTVTFAAPWWAPESIQEPVHDRFCSGRPRTILNVEVRSKKRRGGDYLNFMSVTIEDSDVSKKNPLMKFNRKKSIGVDATGERILVENLNGRQKGIAEFGAPWALP